MIWGEMAQTIAFSLFLPYVFPGIDSWYPWIWYIPPHPGETATPSRLPLSFFLSFSLPYKDQHVFEEKNLFESYSILYCVFLLSGSLALQILSLNAVKLLFLSFYSVYFHSSIILMQLCFHIFVTFIVTWEYFFISNNNNNNWVFSLFLFLSATHIPIPLAFFIYCARFSSFECYFSPSSLF